MALIYVTGHRNPDADSIGAAIGYAELKQRLSPEDEYEPVRLGDLNAQTKWLLERSGAQTPDLLPHVLLRVRDVMRERFPLVSDREPVRNAGLTMARESLDLVPVIDDQGRLAGAITERVLAHRYIRESREASRLEMPTPVRTIAQVLEGDLTGSEDFEVAGRVWVLARETASMTDDIAAGDVAVVGDRHDAQRRALELGVGLLITTGGTHPADDLVSMARAQGTAVIVSPLDSYVSARLLTLATPCRALMDLDPLAVRADDLVSEIADAVKEVDYRAAIAVDGDRRPIGLITRTDLVAPAPRRVILVDHAERAQSAPGIEHAQIVEILDHHNVGSIETKVPVAATFDPVGSTATLVIERFRLNGMEPRPATATMLLGAILSDTVVLNSPTTTDRDRQAVAYLEHVLDLDAANFGRQMFDASSDVADVPAGDLISRDAKDYDIDGGRRIRIAQIETAGDTVLDRRPELLEALRAEQERNGYTLFALMITDIFVKGSKVLAVGDTAALERALGPRNLDGFVDLPGVMSRKRQVAPKLLAIASSDTQHAALDW
jgi:manganese-dependent inorganic pyrophosphatase